MPRVDHYALLGVGSDASAREIRRAYRRLARQHHPDLNPGPDGGARFAELADAYAILSDPAQRTRYDQSRRPPPENSSSTTRGPGLERSPQRGILVLSPDEARHLSHHSLTLADGHGRTIVLPAGAGHGDEIIVLYGHRPVILTIQLHKKT